MSAALRGFALALLVASCANAGNPGSGGGGGGDDAPNKVDASTNHDSNLAPVDTPPPIDAPMIDSPVAIDAPMIDAPAGPFCSTNSQCTNAGECCVTLGGSMGFCGPGQVIAGQCFPQ